MWHMTKRAPRIADPVLTEVLREALEKGALKLPDACRYMRARGGLTQAQFAARIGVATKVVKALESGKGDPTLESLSRIASSMGLQVGFIRSQAAVRLDGMREHVEREAQARGEELRALKRGRTTLKKRHKTTALRGSDFTIELPEIV